MVTETTSVQNFSDEFGDQISQHNPSNEVSNSQGKFFILQSIKKDKI